MDDETEEQYLIRTKRVTEGDPDYLRLLTICSSQEVRQTFAAFLKVLTDLMVSSGVCKLITMQFQANQKAEDVAFSIHRRLLRCG